MRFLFALLVSSFGLLTSSVSADIAKPNIVFILADDLGYADVGFHGSVIKTPNIDNLAAAGAKLESFYAMPVCTPSRSALMTGLYPIRYGRQYNVLRPNSQVGLSLDEKLLPQTLREAGYATLHCGKWHLGDFDRAYWPMQRGFDHTYGPRLDQGREHHHIATKGDELMRDEQPMKDTGSITQLLTREAVRLIEQRDTSKPLFLYVAYRSPHTPLECPLEYSKPYAHLGEPRSTYAGMVAEMDEGIGRIISATEKVGIRDNTLFIFASDNGGLTSKVAAADNQPLRAGKGSIYEGGVRVLACAAWDGHIKAGSVINAPIHMVDWFPTLARLAGASAASAHPLDGRDIWPVITEGQPSPHDELLLNTVGRAGAVRMGDWKLVRNGKAGVDDEGEANGATTREDKQRKRREARNAPDVIELFNLSSDSSEKTNLAESQPEKVKELLQRLDKYAGEAVPPILKPGDEKKPSKGAKP
jgi:arylsulfatase A-like enzyme